MGQIENRIDRRSRVLKDGKIVTLNNQSVIDCSVRDRSDSGARIRCAHQAAVPNNFRLMMPGDNTIRDAHVIWRRGDHLGIVFTGEACRAPPRKW